MSGFRILCESTELAVECAQIAQLVGLDVEPVPVVDAIRSAIEDDYEHLAVACIRAVEPSALVSLATASRTRGGDVPIAFIGDDPALANAAALSRDLGLPSVRELRPLIATIGLLKAGAEKPWTSSIRSLSTADRARLVPVMSPSERASGKISRIDSLHVGWKSSSRNELVALGEARDLAEALGAIRDSRPLEEDEDDAVGGVDPQAVLDVIFGPPRALSDPASKAALRPYDMPLPNEELCSSPSRAASEAARMGFPVRIALASPDLRVWDHPELAVDGVDNAARVRDVFRQMVSFAQEHAKDARILGVTVAATTVAKALMEVKASPLGDGLVLTEIGFADSHGAAARDATATVLPASTAAIERSLQRLAGRELVYTHAGNRREGVVPVVDVLRRVTRFVRDHHSEIASVRLSPIALLVTGGVEVREACVTVNDAFLRSLEAPRPNPS